MENQTLVKDKSSKWRQPTSLKADDLKASIQKTIDSIGEFVKNNNLIIVSETSNLELLKEFESSAIANLSRRSKKRISKKIYNLNLKMTSNRINKFISFICMLIPEFDNRKIRVLPSKEEQVIIDLRFKYKKSKEEFLKIKKEYRTSKKEYHSKGGLYFS